MSEGAVRYSTKMQIGTRLLVLVTIVAQVIFASAARPDGPSEERRLRLYHTHTGEHLDVVYWRDNTYVLDALMQLDRFLRDHRTGDVHHFDRKRTANPY